MTPPIEVLVEDLDAVMDAAGVERATLMGFSDGADLSALHAATHPQRTSGLVIYGTTAVGTVNVDFPWGGASSSGTSIWRASPWVGERSSTSMISSSR